MRRAFLGRLFAAALTIWAGGVAAAGAVPAAQWTQLAPAESGWDAHKLRAIDDAAAALRSDAVLVVHRGAIVYARGDVAQPWNLYSVRKSLLGLLVGIHHARGEIDLDASLGALGIDDREPLSAAEKSASVRQLLQSRSGVYHGAAYETEAMARLRPARGSHAPGSHWYYNNWDFNTLATIFERRTGGNVFDALATELATPLQFQDFDAAKHTRWHKQRVSDHAAYLIDLSARDLARIGLLMARGGRWGERQIVPSTWVADSTRAHSTMASGWQGYGYLWWVPLRAWPFWSRAPGDVFFGWGNHGQYVFADRARDLVVVHRTDGPSLWRKPIEPEHLSPLLERILEAAPR